MVRGTLVVATAFGCALAPACSFKGTGTSSGDDGPVGMVDGPPADAIPDAIPGDAPALCTMWSPHYFDACMIPAGGTGWVVPSEGSPHVYDTAADTYDGAPISDVIGLGHTTIVTVDGLPVRLVSVNQMNVMGGATLQIVGDKPLIVASWDEIRVGGIIDASSTRSPARLGAGANPAACTANAATQGGTGDSGGGSGGGGGGALQGTGGDGGRGDSPPDVAAGPGGTAIGVPAGIRGGCPGADSGAAGPSSSVGPPSDSNTVSVGGAGGGAVMLSARNTLSVMANGQVRAGGAGGAGAPQDSACGGGGGGSGGFVGIEAPSITLDGDLLANGGGGGASETYSGAGIAGNPGEDAHTDDTVAGGGPESGCGPKGGDGSGAGTLGGGPGAENLGCGGGGGGGGAGYVIVRTSGTWNPAGGAVMSPAVTLNP